jgi:DNA-binding protein HU-beta
MERIMTQMELIDLFAEASNLSKAQAKECLHRLGDIAAAELLAGGEVPLPGLGKLVTTEKAARKGRNPRTGKAIEIAAHKAVKFSACKNLKDSLL